MANPRKDDREKLLRRATHAAVALAACLVVAKGVAWALTGSVSILASLVDSALDAGASFINLLAVRVALKPADAEHRFGHGKSEAIAGLGQAVLITGSAAFVAVHAIDRFNHPAPLSSIPVGVVTMVFSILGTFALVSYQRHAILRTSSTAIKADMLHYAGDLASNTGALLALALAEFGYTQLDPLFAIAIAIATFYGAMRIAWETIHVLMDHELPMDVRERVRGIALSHREVLGVHDLRTRQSGPTKLIQFHLEMDGRMSLHDAHRIADEVEAALIDAFPNADVVIHQDPAGERKPRRSLPTPHSLP